MRTRGHSAGFTLLEMLVVLVIIAAASLRAMAANKANSMPIWVSASYETW